MSAISNARWILISQGARTLLQLTSLTVLSRLLPPSEYGLMAMATVVINFANLLRDMGTAAAVVQKQELTDQTTSTVFWLNIGLGLALALGLLALSPLIASLFHAPRLMPVLWVLALVFPITSSGAVHQALFERASGFRLLARIEVVAAGSGLALAIVLAWLGWGVYSLALQALATAVIATGQLWLASRWRPLRLWDRAEFRQLLGFSGHLTGFTFINYFARNADAMIIGRVLGSMPLGIYSQAYKVMMFPLQSMTYVASRALFPIMSRQQHDKPQMARLYFRSVGVIATLTAPLMAGVWLLRAPFIDIMLGPRWAEVGTVLAWLAPVGFIQSLTSTIGTVFMATGRTDILMKQGLISTVLLVSSFLIGVRWGINGVAACYCAANVLNLLPCFYYTLKELNCGVGDLLAAVWKPVLFALLMTALLYPLVEMLRSQQSAVLVELLLPSLVGMLIFGALILAFSRSLLQDLKKLMGAR
ncbi:PST family polysaccharide transporter [Duganella sp. 1224]|uniref:MOP flippase family protein n=1 Tax=Duganella sp. 1224 TaxID=2587052 RepID=UPI0015CAA2E4|nr:MOP flippase family protein [Duganella sp. 1224]NYE62155.1 PST family polysaccharide transporter [Duganella sp. 1224]